jgi:hypothetical protein
VPSSDRSRRQAIGDLAAAMGQAVPRVSGIPWPVLSTLGVAVPFLREVVEARHQFDQDFLSDARATTETFGLSATPWREVVTATAGESVAAR